MATYQNQKSAHKNFEEEDIKIRRSSEEVYLNRVGELLEKSGVLDIVVVVKNGRESHSIGSTLWHRSFFARGEEIIFPLHSEEETYRGLDDDKSYKPWKTNYTPLEKVEAFLKEEVRLTEPRRLFADRIHRLIKMSYAVGQQAFGEDGWDRPRVEMFLYHDYTQKTDWGFFGGRCKSILSAHRIFYRKELYKLTEEDVVRLEEEVVNRARKTAERQKMLKSLFFEHEGVFTHEDVTCKPSEVRHSLVTGRAKDDSWTERHYSIGGVEITQEEYEWLESFRKDLDVPEGYVRVKNDARDLLLVPPVPGQGDILIVIGKRGKKKSVWFRGHPSKCDVELGGESAAGIKKIMLNGDTIDGKWVDLGMWRNPQQIAAWALREVGVENPDEAHIAALAQYYAEHGTVK